MEHTLEKNSLFFKIKDKKKKYIKIKRIKGKEKLLNKKIIFFLEKKNV